MLGTFTFKNYNGALKIMSEDKEKTVVYNQDENLEIANLTSRTQNPYTMAEAKAVIALNRARNLDVVPSVGKNADDKDKTKAFEDAHKAKKKAIEDAEKILSGAKKDGDKVREDLIDRAKAERIAELEAEIKEIRNPSKPAPIKAIPKDKPVSEPATSPGVQGFVPDENASPEAVEDARKVWEADSKKNAGK